MPGDVRRLSSSVALAIASGWSMTSVSAAAPALADEYGTSLSQVGVASGALWVTFAIVQAPGGRLADRVPTPTLAFWGATLMAGLNLVAALVSELGLAIAIRLVAGIVGGTVMVAAARSVTSLGARGQGLVGGATAVGSTLAVACVPVLEPLTGWRTPFVGNVVLALVALAVVLRARNAARAGGEAALGPPVATVGPGAGTDRLRLRLLCLSSALGCSLIAGFALGGWAPTFLEQEAGLGTVAAAVVGSAVVGGSIITRPLGGVLGHGGDFRVVWGSLTCIALGALVLAAAPSPTLQVLALLAVGVCAGLPFAAVIDRSAALSPHAPGRAVGFTGTAGTLVGMAGVVLLGVAVDHDETELMFCGLAAYAVIAALATTWAATPVGDRSGVGA
ncbi:MAG: putative transporter [Solirubrobacterales bacterium]|nr:putative transporter [Solirubrobacterales bacterium]